MFFVVKLHFFKEHVKTPDNPNGEIDIQKIDTDAQLALLEICYGPKYVCTYPMYACTQLSNLLCMKCANLWYLGLSMACVQNCPPGLFVPM